MSKKLLVLFLSFLLILISNLGYSMCFFIENTQAEITIDSVIITPVTNCYTNTDGSIYIYASLSTDSLEYSLNGSAWQSNGNFTGLSGGQKNISIREISNISVTKDTSIIISSPPKLLIEIIKKDVIDTFGSVTIVASGGSGALQYYVGSIPAPSYTVTTFYPNLDTGLYYLSVKDVNSCSLDTTIRIDSIVLLDISLITLKSTSKCHPDNGTPDGTVSISFNNQTDVTLPVSYYLLGRNGNNIIFKDLNNFTSQWYNTVPADTFDVLITDNSNPQRYYQDTIVITGPDPISIGDTNIVTAGCLYIDDGKTDIGEIHLLNISGGTSPYFYQWEHDFSNSTLDVTGVSGGVYIIHITDSKNCASTNPLFVPYDTAKQTSAHIDTLLDITCYGMDYLLEAKISKADNYVWEKYNGSTTNWDVLPTNIANPKEEQWYRVKASNNYNCIDMDSVYLFLFPRFVIDIDEKKDSLFKYTNDLDYPITVIEDLKNNNYTLMYNWSAIGDGIEYLSDTLIKQPIFNIPDLQDQFKYVLTATSNIGCAETDTLSVFIIKDIKIPSAFSPNGDNINDVWNLDFSQYYKTEISIFSRWGEIIYHHDKEYNVLWDGNINGKAAVMGTYYYVVNIDKPTGIETKTGPITIVR